MFFIYIVYISALVCYSLKKLMEPVSVPLEHRQEVTWQGTQTFVGY